MVNKAGSVLIVAHSRHPAPLQCPSGRETLFSALLWVETSPSLTSQQSFSFSALAAGVADFSKFSLIDNGVILILKVNLK